MYFPDAFVVLAYKTDLTTYVVTEPIGVHDQSRLTAGDYTIGADAAFPEIGYDLLWAVRRSDYLANPAAYPTDTGRLDSCVFVRRR